jgi:hypothetical protein
MKSFMQWADEKKKALKAQEDTGEISNKGLITRIEMAEVVHEFYMKEEGIEAFDLPCSHDWFHYRGDYFEHCKRCGARQLAARER